MLSQSFDHNQGLGALRSLGWKGIYLYHGMKAVVREEQGPLFPVILDLVYITLKVLLHHNVDLLGLSVFLGVICGWKPSLEPQSLADAVLKPRPKL